MSTRLGADPVTLAYPSSKENEMCACTPDAMCDHHQRQFDRECDEFLRSLTTEA